MHSKAACRKKAPKSTLKQICPPKKNQPKNGRRLFSEPLFSLPTFPIPLSSPVWANLFFGGPKKLGKNPLPQKREKSGSPDRKLSGSVSKKRGRSKKNRPLILQVQEVDKKEHFSRFFFFSRVEVTSRNNLFLAALAY